MNFRTVTLAVLLVGVGVGQGPFIMSAQDASGTRIDTGADQMLNSADKAFAIRAAQGGTAEIEMGKLAVAKASDPDVKAFGQQMVDDHTKATDQLASAARQEHMTLPTALTAKNQAMYDRLEKFRNRFR